MSFEWDWKSSAWMCIIFCCIILELQNKYMKEHYIVVHSHAEGENTLHVICTKKNFCSFGQIDFLFLPIFTFFLHLPINQCLVSFIFIYSGLLCSGTLLILIFIGNLYLTLFIIVCLSLCTISTWCCLSSLITHLSGDCCLISLVLAVIHCQSFLLVLIIITQR